MMQIVTCIAPLTIDVIKHWGCSDDNLVLPLTDSISCTLTSDQIFIKTTVMVNPTFQENRFWLNDIEGTFDQKLTNCLSEIKKLAKAKELLSWKLHICSENGFVELATSKVYPCVIRALATLYRVEGDISGIIRKAAHKACCSIYGGWVRWHKGLLATGEDSIPTQIVPHCHWPQIRVLVLNFKPSDLITVKPVEKSAFLHHRIEEIVPKRVQELIGSVKKRDFQALAKLIMQDSNQFHSLCLDTYPPCFYLSDQSRVVMEMVHCYNQHRGAAKIAYTFDTESRAFLFLLEDEVDEVVGLICDIFPSLNSGTYGFRNVKKSVLKVKRQNAGLLTSVICAKVGDGPRMSTEHLLSKDGLPMNYFSERNYVKKIYRN